MKKADLENYCEELLVLNKNLMEENKKLIDSAKEHLKTKEILEEDIKEAQNLCITVGVEHIQTLFKQIQTYKRKFKI